ncbi:Diphthamide biosynthesis protein 2 [Chelonia mydas]|uniref:Diphthamide biosynthesis protein 2 n=1 Tax=Chelonia mydas TaxID=8469 RepID=M7C1B3_CHEMY|nr:Diphthamide biosynthesis protein 2 [Chelonia mydas]
MATLFSHDGAEVVQRALAVKEPAEALDEFYELERAAAFVTASGFRRVPLHCCVDEVAAEHVGAEAVVHYGPACLSPCRKLLVLHVFGRQPLDTERCAGAFRELYPDRQSHVVVLSDVVYAHALGELEQLLGPEYPHVVFSRLASDEAPDCPQGPGLVRQFGRLFAVAAQSGLKDYAMFYSLDSNRALLRRLYLVERARDARVGGILVGTLGVAGYLSILEHLRGTLSRAGKRSYTLAMGKLSPAKLANFLEVDVFVLVACPQNSLLDSRDFYRPVVTPYELELACNPAREWSSLYVTDFRDLLPGGCAHVGFPDTVPGEGDVPDVSLITGELRAAGLSSSPAPSSSSALACRNPALALAEISPAASFLESRSWRGLEQQLGQMPVTKAVPGRRGIAIAYEDEACG